MRTTKIFLHSFLLSSIGFLLNSCDKKEKEITIPAVETGVYVLNQGDYGANDASLSYYDFATSTVTTDIFSAKNNRGLGDLAQDMIKYGSKIYISVAGSGIVEVIDAKTASSLKSIPIKNNQGQSLQPRSFAVANGKIYVTIYDGHVTQIDTTTFNIDKTVEVGSKPEGITVANNKLYVANSGGMQDSTVSVIDLSTFTEITKIKVVLNPNIIKADAYGDVYVLSMGNYSNIPYTIQKIQTSSNKVTKITNLEAYNFTISGDIAYVYYNNFLTGKISYTLYNVKDETISKQNFIPSTALKNTPYSIDINPVNSNIYIGETDYLNTGEMNCFKPDGTLSYSFKVGKNPVKTIFMTSKQ